MRVTSRWTWAWAVVLLGACSGSHEPGGGDGGTDASVDAAPDGREADSGRDASPDGREADGGPDSGRDGGPEPLACRKPSDCMLAIRDCCGPCGRPTLDDFDVIHVAIQDAHRRMVCSDTDPVCPACPQMPNPNLGATCEAATGECVGFDVERHEVSACTSDEQCVVRARGCCECGADTSPWNLVALHRDHVRDYEALVCDPMMACTECAPVYPDHVEAYCDRESGHCRLRELPVP